MIDETVELTLIPDPLNGDPKLRPTAITPSRFVGSKQPASQTDHLLGEVNAKAVS
jgi:hypothetical protein